MKVIPNYASRWNNFVFPNLQDHNKKKGWRLYHTVQVIFVMLPIYSDKIWRFTLFIGIKNKSVILPHFSKFNCLVINLIQTSVKFYLNSLVEVHLLDSDIGSQIEKHGNYYHTIWNNRRPLEHDVLQFKVYSLLHFILQRTLQMHS